MPLERSGLSLLDENELDAPAVRDTP
jgi:hypothetical protein